MNPAIFLSGKPGVGKTTAVKSIISLLGRRPGGFYTREVRSQSHRTGFEIVTLDGRTAWLAGRASTKTFSEEIQLGKYRVNLRAIDSFAVPALQRALAAGGIIIIDEVGPMELASELFRQTVLEILGSDAPLVGTLMQRPNPFADRVRRHPRAQVKTVTLTNRNDIPAEVVAELGGR